MSVIYIDDATYKKMQRSAKNGYNINLKAAKSGGTYRFDEKVPFTKAQLSKLRNGRSVRMTGEQSGSFLNFLIPALASAIPGVISAIGGLVQGSKKRREGDGMYAEPLLARDDMPAKPTRKSKKSANGGFMNCVRPCGSCSTSAPKMAAFQCQQCGHPYHVVPMQQSADGLFLPSTGSGLYLQNTRPQRGPQSVYQSPAKTGGFLVTDNPDYQG